MEPVVRKTTPSSDGAGIYPQVQGDPPEHLAQPSGGTPGTRGEDYVFSSAADYVYGKQVGKVKVALLHSVQTTYS